MSAFSKDFNPGLPYNARGRGFARHFGSNALHECKLPRYVELPHHDRRRWEIIRGVLSPDSKVTSFKDLQSTIKKYLSPEWKGNDPDYFPTLRKFVTSMDEKESSIFFTFTLPSIFQLSLKLPDFFPESLSFLRSESSKAVQLSQIQIACLLANGFMCTFPWQPYRDDYPGLVPTINFALLYITDLPANVEKLKCLDHYFRCIAERMRTSAPELQQTVIYQRRAGGHPLTGACVPSSP
jgi:poly(ADP-ribose) glycohydrolase